MNVNAPAPGVADERSAELDRTLVAAFLENIPDHVFFKDRRSRFIAVSRSVVRNFGRSSSAEIVGRTDFDFFGPQHARRSYEDEQQIIRTGQPLINKLERETWPDGRITWALTSKVPLRNEAGEIIGTFGLSRDVTQSRQMELALEKAHEDLIEASRRAGMAEVANNVLLNVSNVLNSLNVSAAFIAGRVRQSKAESLAKVAALLREHRHDLGAFLTADPKGRRIPELIRSLAKHAVAERDQLLAETGVLQQNIDQVKEIVAMQQAYAMKAGVAESLDPVALMEDSLRMTAGLPLRHDVRVERAFQPTPRVTAEKAKALQILVNLIRNAKHACDENGRDEKIVTLRIEPGPTPERVRLFVQDTGVGIPWENLTRIFSPGFSGRPSGHSFSLHASALAAKEMKGSLTVDSEGIGLGAVFVLELPVAAAPSTAP